MKLKLAMAAGLLAATALTVQAQTVVGYNKVTCLANSDTVVALPFSESQEAVYTVSGKSEATVSVSESLPAGTYDGTYYIRFLDGSAAGLWSTISVQDTGDELDVDDTAVLADVAADDTFGVYAHRTIGSVFTTNLQDVVWDANTQILLPRNDEAGTNKGYTVIGWNGSQWKSGFTDYTNTILNPEEAFIIRNGSGSDLSWIASGTVMQGKVGRYLPGNGAQDIVVGPLPKAVALQDLNLEGEGQILLPRNDEAGTNKGYTVVGWTGSQWKSGFTDYSSTEIPAGEGFILRRDASHTTASKWTVE